MMLAGLGLLAVRLVLPLAVGGGEAAVEETALESGGNGTADAIVSVAALAAGYVLLFLLWRYVFSEKAKAKRREPPDRPGRV
jgi:hypothetical protein